MEGDKSGRQGGCSGKIFVDQDPLHREVRTPIADATWGNIFPIEIYVDGGLDIINAF